MPFGLVSAWNKRRRSKSYDHTGPCMFFHSFFSSSSLQICFSGSSPTLNANLPTLFQGHISRWSSGNSMIKHLNRRKSTIMAHQCLHSKKWKRQHLHSVTRTFWGKEDLAVYTEELCAQERYVNL